MAYTAVASCYAEKWFGDPVVEPLVEEFLRLINREGAVLDVGCGPGRDVQSMLKRGIIAVGIDNCEGMLFEARKRVPSGLFRNMDMRQMVFPECSFAGLWVCGAFHHVPTDEALSTLNEFKRVLQPRGVLCLSVKVSDDAVSDEHRLGQNGFYAKIFRPDEIIELIKRAGFQIIRRKISTSSKNTSGVERVNTWLTVMVQKRGSIQLRSKGIDELSCDLCLTGRHNNYQDHGIHRSASILWGDANFFVIPDLSPLAEGHLLIVSLSHLCSFGGMHSESVQSVEGVKHLIRKIFKEAYNKPALFFEHGATRPGRAGACIDHAHLHCLPSDLCFKKAVEQKLGFGIKADVRQLQDMYQSGQSYLFVEEEFHGGWAYPVDFLPCQFHRRMLAGLMGGKEWDWNLTRYGNLERETYSRTLARLIPLVDGKFREEIHSYRSKS